MNAWHWLSAQWQALPGFAHSTVFILALMILPLFVTLDRLDPAMREASKDLGASRWAERARQERHESGAGRPSSFSMLRRSRLVGRPAPRSRAAATTAVGCPW